MWQVLFNQCVEKSKSCGMLRAQRDVWQLYWNSPAYYTPEARHKLFCLFSIVIFRYICNRSFFRKKKDYTNNNVNNIYIYSKDKVKYLICKFIYSSYIHKENPEITS